MVAKLAVVAAMLALHNQARAKNCLPPLRADPVLVHAAQVKAAEIKRCGFQHDACGKPWTAVLPVRPWLGENIAEGYLTIGGAFRGWMRSKGHRENILRRQFRRAGFARVGAVYVAEFSS